MRTFIIRKYGLPLALLMILAGLFSVMPSCGGGGGGGTKGPPYIDAQIFSLPTGSSLPGNESASVTVLDDDTGYPIETAVVTINSMTLFYNSTYEDYEGDVVIAPGESVVLNVSVGGSTYTASGTQFASYPVIVEPANGASWFPNLPNTIKWSGNYPTANTFLGLGILENDPNGELLWPSDGYLLELSSSETSYEIPENSLTSRNGLVIVAIGKVIPISGAAPDSMFVISGFNYTPITVRANPTTLASGVNNSICINDIAVDATSVYWTESENVIGGNVKKVGINGGTVKTLASGLIPGSIRVDSTSIYWIESSFHGNEAAIKKIGINGGAVTTLISGTNIGNISVDSASVYWIESGTIKKQGINGGTVTTLASGLPYYPRIVVDSESVYWVVSDPTVATVNKVGINGGAVTTLVSGTNILNIAVDSTSVYWTEGPALSPAQIIKKIGINGGPVTTVASRLSSAGGIVSIALDSTSLYWIEYTYTGITTVNKVGINGGSVITIAAEHEGGIGSIALDSTSLYYASRVAIKKVDK